MAWIELVKCGDEHVVFTGQIYKFHRLHCTIVSDQLVKKYCTFVCHQGSPQQDLNDALSTPPRAKSKGLGWFTSPGGAEGQQSTPRQVNAISWDEIILPDSPLSLAERFDSPERGVTDLEVESTPHQRKKKKKKKRKRVRNPYVMAVLEQEKTAGCKFI